MSMGITATAVQFQCDVTCLIMGPSYLLAFITFQF